VLNMNIREDKSQTSLRKTVKVTLNNEHTWIKKGSTSDILVLVGGGKCLE
jgi:hypothetical protein